MSRMPTIVPASICLNGSVFAMRSGRLDGTIILAEERTTIDGTIELELPGRTVIERTVEEALGHFADVWRNPDFLQHVLQGTRMAALQYIVEGGRPPRMSV